MIALALPFVLQAAAMTVDEFVCHRRRGLPRWERVGHPLDALTSMAAYSWLLATRPSRRHLAGYAVLVTVSCLFVTKDEKVHASRCTPGEHWLHAVLFMLHPVVFIAAGYAWWHRLPRVLILTPLALTGTLATHQLVHWRRPCPETPP